eukprot:4594707-Alexandrium_andersonii.AAC.1
MLGSYASQKLSLHASETNGYLHFAQQLLDRHGAHLGTSAQHFQAALTELLRIYRVIKNNEKTFPPRAVQDPNRR